MRVALLLSSIAAVSFLVSAPAASGQTQRDVTSLRNAALTDDIAYDIIEGLTTEVGPRLAGTEAEARARDWAVRKLKELGFANVRVEPFDMPTWVRGEERAEIEAPFPQPVSITALGKSAATPVTGLRAEVVAFDSLADLEAAPEAHVQGKIAFVNHAMEATQDGSSYGYYGPARWNGPSIASRKGAAALIIRSIGTDSHRTPHTGTQNWAEGTKPIPAAALSNPDADQLQRILKRGKPVTMRLVLTPRNMGLQRSGNVVAEIPGTDPSAGVILLGAHLDSWDLGTGAHDNGAGVGIVTAAAKRIMDAGRPRRTIRIVLFGAEEVGTLGSKAYFKAHKNDGDVVLVAESDTGADRVWRVKGSFPPQNATIVDEVAAALVPLGVVRGDTAATAGADLGFWAREGFAAIDLNPDATRYFVYHHTADDTLDKVDISQLRQSVAAWTAMLSVVANHPNPIGKTK